MNLGVDRGSGTSSIGGNVQMLLQIGMTGLACAAAVKNAGMSSIGGAGMSSIGSAGMSSIGSAGMSSIGSVGMSSIRGSWVTGDKEGPEIGSAGSAVIWECSLVARSVRFGVVFSWSKEHFEDDSENLVGRGCLESVIVQESNLRS